MSRRTERVGNLIRNVLAEHVPRRLHDPRIEPLTSITRVQVSEDLSLARVYVSVMAPPTRQRLTVEALQHAAGRLRRIVGRQVRLRKIPTLVFELDESVRRAFETVRAIDEAMTELGEQRPFYADDEQTDTPSDDQAAPPDAPLSPEPSGPTSEGEH